MPYQPKPIDTSKVVLPKTILDLVEVLAEHAHDVWAVGRVEQGWKYGPQRDDNRKENPCLVPYADLPDEEKKHDRNAALGTLKAMIAMGYRIEKP